MDLLKFKGILACIIRLIGNESHTVNGKPHIDIYFVLVMYSDMNVGVRVRQMCRYLEIHASNK